MGGFALIKVEVYSNWRQASCVKGRASGLESLCFQGCWYASLMGQRLCQRKIVRNAMRVLELSPEICYSSREVEKVLFERVQRMPWFFREQKDVMQAMSPMQKDTHPFYNRGRG